MITTDFDPEALHKIEYQIGLKRDQFNRNQAKQWDLQQEEKRLKGELEELEIKKIRLFTGRNI